MQIHVMSGRSRDFDVSWQPGFNGNSDITSFLLQWKNASGILSTVIDPSLNR